MRAKLSGGLATVRNYTQFSHLMSRQISVLGERKADSAKPLLGHSILKPSILTQREWKNLLFC